MGPRVNGSLCTMPWLVRNALAVRMQSLFSANLPKPPSEHPPSTLLPSCLTDERGGPKEKKKSASTASDNKLAACVCARALRPENYTSFAPLSHPHALGMRRPLKPASSVQH